MRLAAMNDANPAGASRQRRGRSNLAPYINTRNAHTHCFGTSGRYVISQMGSASDGKWISIPPTNSREDRQGGMDTSEPISRLMRDTS